jgi:hypothetical protein
LANAFLNFVFSNKEEVHEWKGQGLAAEFFPTQLGKSEQQYRNPNASSAPKEEIKQ